MCSSSKGKLVKDSKGVKTEGKVSKDIVNYVIVVLLGICDEPDLIRFVSVIEQFFEDSSDIKES